MFNGEDLIAGCKGNAIIAEVVKFIESKECTKKMCNYKDRDGNTPLYVAAAENKFEIVEALVKKGANVNYVKESNSLNPLMVAIFDSSFQATNKEKANTDIINFLVDAGTNLEPTLGESAFNLACLTEKTEAIRKILGSGKEINLHFRDRYNATGLGHLEQTGNDEGLRLVQNYLLNKSLKKDLPTTGLGLKKLKV
jgi:ankyrin repeat protein